MKWNINDRIIFLYESCKSLPIKWQLFICLYLVSYTPRLMAYDHQPVPIHIPRDPGFLRRLRLARNNIID
jgi:hypothetical protein